MTFMANMVVSKNEKQELLNTFEALDLDGNGVLTVDELVQGRTTLIQAIKNFTLIKRMLRSRVKSPPS